MAQIMQAQADYNEKMKMYKLRKAGGKKGLRKPTMAHLPYNNIYFKALNSK